LGIPHWPLSSTLPLAARNPFRSNLARAHQFFVRPEPRVFFFYRAAGFYALSGPSFSPQGANSIAGDLPAAPLDRLIHFFPPYVIHQYNPALFNGFFFLRNDSVPFFYLEPNFV